MPADVGTYGLILHRGPNTGRAVWWVRTCPRCLQRGAFHAARSCGEGVGVSFYVPCQCGAMGLGGCILGSALLKLAAMALARPSDEPERIARFEPSTDRQAVVRRVELNSRAKDINVENRQVRDSLHRNRAVQSALGQRYARRVRLLLPGSGRSGTCIAWSCRSTRCSKISCYGCAPPHRPEPRRALVFTATATTRSFALGSDGRTDP